MSPLGRLETEGDGHWNGNGHGLCCGHWTLLSSSMGGPLKLRHLVIAPVYEDRPPYGKSWFKP